MVVTTKYLEAFEGKKISDICQIGYISSDLSHCEHFVGHALKFDFGVTCRMMKTDGPREAPAATIRVHELFSRCPKVGLWDDEPYSISPCLIFITKRTNVDLKNRRMENVPRKHVGIAIGTSVWHYSNSRDMVVKVTDSIFRKHYPGDGYALFFGELPR